MIWIVFGVLALLAGARYRMRLRSSRPPRGAAVDDDAVRRIIEEGRLSTAGEDPPLDMKAAAEAEEEFWADSWDEPEEYGR